MKIPEKIEVWVMLKNRKSYFLDDFMKASGNLRACNLKVPCSFVFRCMLHFKTRCASLIFSSKTIQSCIILKLFQIDRKQKNLRSKADQISERVLRTIFLFGAECFVLSRGVRFSESRNQNPEKSFNGSLHTTGVDVFGVSVSHSGIE